MYDKVISANIKQAYLLQKIYFIDLLQRNLISKMSDATYTNYFTIFLQIADVTNFLLIFI